MVEPSNDNRLMVVQFYQPRPMRGGAVVARWVHTPKVVGAIPTSATIYGGDSLIVELLIVTQ